MKSLGVIPGTGVPLVATKRCHYLKKEDAAPHDACSVLGRGFHVGGTQRHALQRDEFYTERGGDVRPFFSHCPEAVRNTLRNRRTLQPRNQVDQMHLPRYQVRTEKPPITTSETLCLAGLQKRYGALASEYLAAACIMSCRSSAKWDSQPTF